jgi:hypothetical protein
MFIAAGRRRMGTQNRVIPFFERLGRDRPAILRLRLVDSQQSILLRAATS